MVMMTVRSDLHKINQDDCHDYLDQDDGPMVMMTMMVMMMATTKTLPTKI